MAIEILMPALSPTMEEGTLAKWLVDEGAEVRSGDVIAEIETDKATMEVEALDDGTIGRIARSGGHRRREGQHPSRPCSRKARQPKRPCCLNICGRRSCAGAGGPACRPRPRPWPRPGLPPNRLGAGETRR